VTEGPCQRRVAIHRSEPCTYGRAETEAAVASVLAYMGLQEAGPPSGRGPLGSLISPGECVLLKPNMLRPPQSSGVDRDCAITHGEVVRAVAMSAAQALEGRGRLVIGDGPARGSDFSAIVGAMKLEALQRDVRERFGFEVELLDLREAPGDPLGYVDFDLGEWSEFRDHADGDRYRSNDEDVAITRFAHSDGRHCYRVARTPLLADVFINLPKMKTHQKTGVTLSLKNIVGIHGDRNHLPHFTTGRPTNGGDESPWSASRLTARGSMIRWTKRLADQLGLGETGKRALKGAGYHVLGAPGQAIRDGNWYGNDTAWRMVLDLNKILLYGRPDGSWEAAPRKRCLTIVDGIVGGEGNGPVAPDPKPAGLLVAGLNAVAVDTASSILMGFDPEQIKMVSNAWRIGPLPLVDFLSQEVECRSNVSEWNGDLQHLMRLQHCGFAPCSGWRGHVERSWPS
jgi:uncharacterized protein (DUF362 family)